MNDLECVRVAYALLLLDDGIEGNGGQREPDLVVRLSETVEISLADTRYALHRWNGYIDLVQRQRSAHRSDDALAALLGATAAQVSSAMAYGLLLGDHEGVKIVTTWLDMAERLSVAAPPLTEVAAEADVDGGWETVREALSRFEGYVRACQ